MSERKEKLNSSSEDCIKRGQATQNGQKAACIITHWLLSPNTVVREGKAAGII